MDGAGSLLQPGVSCWRTAHADRVALLLENDEYFAAAKVALRAAQRSITLLAWVFDPLARLSPDRSRRSGDPDDPDRIGLLLRTLAEQRPELTVRILAWKMPVFIAASQAFAPQRARSYFAGSGVRFHLDRTLPMSACQHQKVLVIDDRVAFVSGGDIGVDRWDTEEHIHADPRRRLPNGRRYPARHEVTMLVEGEAAQALGDHCRTRWRQATGETLAPCVAAEDPAPLWPADLQPNFTDVEVGVVRTEPDWKGRESAQECLELHIGGIAAAKRVILLENQYLASPWVVEALAARLCEPDGPQVVCIGPAQSPSFFDQMTMDSARTTAVRRLAGVAPPGRFAAYSPRTAGGDPIIVHSKVTIIDDRLLRVGSCNLNNRGMGLDTELDLALDAALEPQPAAAMARIAGFRDRLVGHWLACAPEAVAAATREHGLIGAIERLDTGGRLQPVDRRRPPAVARLVAAYHVGDPTEPSDAWRPWRRLKRMKRLVSHYLPRWGLPPPADDAALPTGDLA